jgi:hypothetical protein
MDELGVAVVLWTIDYYLGSPKHISRLSEGKVESDRSTQAADGD